MSLRSLFQVNKKAFTAILVGSIMAILIGSVLLAVTYAVLSPIVNIGITAVNGSAGAGACTTMSNSFVSTIGVLTQALTITGISMIVAGVAGIIYMLMGVAGVTGGQRGR